MMSPNGVAFKVPRKKKAAPGVPPEFCFANELEGENPPRLSELRKIYELATEVFALQPWRMLDDSGLIVFRDSRSGETCHCCVMGALGEVFAVHAYIGAESFRLYHRIQAGEKMDPSEFFALQRSVYVEFVPRAELEKQDRELLAWLGHPSGRGLAAPIFRAMRPGFHPWFVTTEEVQTLSECMRATIAVSKIVAERGGGDLWDRKDFYPKVSHIEDGTQEPKIETVRSTVAQPPSIDPVRLDITGASSVRGNDYPIKGAIEFDHVVTTVSIGEKNRRKRVGFMLLAADPVTGMIVASDALDSRTTPGDAIANAFLKTVKATRALPTEIRVRSKELRDAVAPFMESFGVAVRVSAKLPAVDAAKAHMLQYFGGMI
jgi:hypothetical protein